jgi:hypothetical protein
MNAPSNARWSHFLFFFSEAEAIGWMRKEKTLSIVKAGCSSSFKASPIDIAERFFSDVQEN